MEIIARARINGTEVNGVIIDDMGITTPAYFKVLHNKVYADTLKESGWGLTRLPYGFISPNGESIDSLPVNDVTLTTEEEDLNLNLMEPSQCYSNSELTKLFEIKAETVKAAGFAVEPTYTESVATRENLSEFLNVTRNSPVILPLNYFVKPQARIQADSVGQDSQTVYFLERIAARQVLSIAQWTELVKWEKSIGLINDDYTFFDVLNGYMHWGYDGLDTTIISRKVETDNIYRIELRMADPNNLNANKQTKEVLVGVTKDDDLLIPEGYEGKKFYFHTGAETRNSSIRLMEALENMEEGELAPESRTIYEPCPRGIIQCAEGDIVFDEHVITFRGKRLSQLRVVWPDNSPVPTYLLCAKNEQKLMDYALLRTLAAEIVKKAVVPCNISSYEMLIQSGMSPLSALRKFSGYTRDGKRVKSAGGTNFDPSVITYEDVMNYISGRLEKLAETPGPQQNEFSIKFDRIESFVTGEANIDNLNDAQAYASNKNSVDKLYSTFVIAHEHLGLSVSDIYQTVKELEDNCEGNVWLQDEVDIRFEGKGYFSHYTVRRDDSALIAAQSDMNRYMEDQAATSAYFVWVDDALVELGTKPSKTDRHIGLRGRYIYRDTVVGDFLRSAVDTYSEACVTQIIDPSKRSTAASAANRFAAKALFETIQNGSYTLPKAIFGGDQVITVDARMCNDLRTRLRPVDMLTSLFSNLAYQDTRNINDRLQDLWRIHTVNAFVTADRIFPKPGYTINEASIVSQFYDEATLGAKFAECWPVTYSKPLRDANRGPLMSEAFESLGFDGCEYGNNAYRAEPAASEDDTCETFFDYIKNAVRWKSKLELDKYPDIIVHHPPHPVELQYPQLYKEVDGYEQVPGTNVGKQPWKRLVYDIDGREITHREVTSKDYPRKKVSLYDEQTLKSSLVVEGFSGYTAEEIYLTNGACLTKTIKPAMEVCCVRNGHILVEQNGEYVERSVSTITQDDPAHGIYKITGNTFIIFDSLSRMWRLRK